MPNKADGIPTFNELRVRCDLAMANSRELVAQLRELLEEHERLQEQFVESHRSEPEEYENALRLR